MCSAECIECTWSDAALLWSKEFKRPLYFFDSTAFEVRHAWFERARIMRKAGVE